MKRIENTRFFKKLLAFCLMFHLIPEGFDLWDNPDEFEFNLREPITKHKEGKDE